MEQVVTAGEPGLREVTADILLINGVETDREILQEQTVQEPVTEVRLVGTKQIPVGEDGSYSTGSMIWPVPSGGLVTGRFGDWRGTHAHTALDIAESYNTTIVATDSGRVISAGWNEGGYGYNVWIDHGNGITSPLLPLQRGARRGGSARRTGPADCVYGYDGQRHRHSRPL